MTQAQGPFISHNRVHKFEDEPFGYFVDASELGLSPGPMPKRLPTNMGNEQDFIFMRRDEAGATHYAQQLGCLTLMVFND
jgi:hypothetical protein